MVNARLVLREEVLEVIGRGCEMETMKELFLVDDFTLLALFYLTYVLMGYVAPELVMRRFRLISTEWCIFMVLLAGITGCLIAPHLALLIYHHRPNQNPVIAFAAMVLGLLLWLLKEQRNGTIQWGDKRKRITKHPKRAQ